MMKKMSLRFNFVMVAIIATAIILPPAFATAPGLPQWGRGASWEKLSTSPKGNKYWIPKDFTKEQIKEAEVIMALQESQTQIVTPEMARKFYLPGDHVIHYDAVGKFGDGGWGIYRSAEDIFKGYAPQLASIKDSSVAMEETHINIVGDVAWAIMVQTFTSTKRDDETLCKYTWRQSDVMQKIDGQWYIVHTHASIPFFGGNGDMCDMKQPVYFSGAK